MSKIAFAVRTVVAAVRRPAEPFSDQAKKDNVAEIAA